MHIGRLVSLAVLLFMLIGCVPNHVDRVGDVQPTARRDTLINTGWQFVYADPADASSAKFDDSAWQPVTIPHTWNAKDGQDGGKNYARGIGWYRKRLTIAPAARTFLQFDAANAVADVFVNGKHAGKHAGGYSIFRFDVTEFVQPGENTIAVKVSNADDKNLAPLSADFTFFGGIYRDVHLVQTDDIHIDLMDFGSPGVYAKTTDVSAESAMLEIKTLVRNDSARPSELTVSSSLLEGQTKTNVARLETRFSIPANKTKQVVQYLVIPKPRLWNGRADPYLYELHSAVLADGSRDETVQPVGFRSFRVDPDLGFFLNGKPYDLHGVNFHQDFLDQGWALSREQKQQTIDLIDELGVTCVRKCHYQHSEFDARAFDRLGIVTWDEIPFVNAATASPEFFESTKTQMRELIRQNFNHPSIFVWGIANEIVDKSAENSLSAELAALVATEDPTRLSTCATNQGENNKVAFHTQLTAWNRYEGWYYGRAEWLGDFLDRVHARHPTQPIGIAEYGAGASVRIHSAAYEGYASRTQPYVPPKPPATTTAATSTRPTTGPAATQTTRPATRPREVRDHSEEWQSLIHEYAWRQLSARKYVWWKTLWNMYDFAADNRNEGDTPGRNDKGLVTYDRRTKKDAFYFYQANWSDRPVLHIAASRFTQREKATTEVRVYSNCASVALTVNGQSLAARTATPADSHTFVWENVSLQDGENVVEARGDRGSTTLSDRCTWTLIHSTTAPTTAPVTTAK